MKLGFLRQMVTSSSRSRNNLKEREQIAAAKKFSNQWNNRGHEKGETQIFWLTLFRDVFGIEKPERFFKFEEPIKVNGHNFWIDVLIPSTRVLIEQKSFDIDLNKPSIQSDRKVLTPFEQAKRYTEELPYSQRPRWIIICNFKELHIYDVEDFNYFQLRKKYLNAEKNNINVEEQKFEPTIIYIEKLSRDYKLLNFLIDPNDKEARPELKISARAAKTIGDIYDTFDKLYKSTPDRQTSLNILCIRLVFCFYAEDAGIFKKNQFYNYLNNFNTEDQFNALLDLFKILNQREDERDDNISDLLKEFPYVDGGLFEEVIDLPKFNDYIRSYLLRSSIQQLNWSKISPTIFGAMFESILNPEKRRAGGMHYTSVENIHKVIDPLFMDKLHDEFKAIKRTRKDKIKRLKKLQDKLAELKFLDPACGSGNFLTETYLSLRKLENNIIKEICRFENNYSIIKVSINQFYGIEINDFAVDIAKMALWIAENQMLQDTEIIIHQDLQYLPLKNYKTITKANALRIDWTHLIDKFKLNYIIGNPPFLGGMIMSSGQKADMLNVWHDEKCVGELDYVSAWYKKAVEFIENTKIECAFVSTNSIVQGQQAVTMWKPLIVNYKLKINFAYRTFKWMSESIKTSAVHCVIISFALYDKKNKFIVDNSKKILVKQINSYLLDAPQIFIESRHKPLYQVPPMYFGSMPRDGGNLIIENEDYKSFINYEPTAKKFIKKFIGAQELINGKDRYCLWLVNANPKELANIPLIAQRIEAVKKFRLNSKAKSTRKFAEKPELFCQIAQPNSNYIAVPRVSSENRKYIPMGFIESDVIASDALQIIPDASLYHFGILTSSVHMAWTRLICGRLEMRYRYSKDIVYNNFPWPFPTSSQRQIIEQTADDILKIRALYSNRSLASLYNEALMPDKLRSAHKANDEAVMKAYNFDDQMSEFGIVAALMKMYQNRIEAIK